MEAGRLNEPSRFSKPGTLTPQSLPSQKSTHAQSARRDSRLASTGGWRQESGHQDAQRRRAAAASPTDAGCGVGLLGNLTLAAFVALSVFMAAVAIHQEERLAPSERQLLELRR